MNDENWTPEEMMTVAAARHFRNRTATFVGVGLPSVAACVARALYTREIVLVYESGAIGAKPSTAPLSIADWELAETADLLVSVPEMFSYWLQGGRMDTAFLGTAQIDRFGNLNTTVIGSYVNPKVRLPGAGGGPEIASAAKELFIIVRQTPRSFVKTLDFVTTVGRRRTLNAVITDLGILRPDRETQELTLVTRHPGVSLNDIKAATGWPVRIASDLEESPPPTPIELDTLRELHRRTKEMHDSGVRFLRVA